MLRMVEFLNDLPLAGLMLVITLGFLLGRLEWREMALGPAGGTLFVAILLGWLGLDYRAFYGSAEPRLSIGHLGFALFIYSVGFEAGPRFFSCLRGGRGWRFTVVGALVNVFAVLLVVAGGRLFGVDENVAAGVLAGALTSAPTYASAAEICADPTVLSVTFALCYPFGLLGVIVLVQFLPKLMKDDLATGGEDGDEPKAGPLRVRGEEVRRAFEVTNPEAIGKTLEDLSVFRETGCHVTRLHRGNQVFVPQGDTILEKNDHVMARGQVANLQVLEGLLGREVFDEDLFRRMASPRAIHVFRKEAAGKRLLELGLVNRFHCLITRILRHGEIIVPTADVRIERDDVVHVVGLRDDVRAVAHFLGRFERSSQETDIFLYAGGIVLGLFLGSLELSFASFQFQFGSAAGLLAMGVLMGRFQRVGRFSAHVPVAARQLVRDLGILLFIAETGVRAGQSAGLGVAVPVLPAILIGVFVTVVPMLLALFVGRRFLHLRAVDAWGSVCGGMTSSAALATIRRASDSTEPAISYAASYAVASILATLAGQIVVLIF